jgi:acetyl-CoA carboxylase biotin carboxylase subunit
VPLHRMILDDPAFRQGGYNIHHLEHWITARAAQQ